jgi:hypothetical protein
MQNLSGLLAACLTASCFMTACRESPASDGQIVQAVHDLDRTLDESPYCTPAGLCEIRDVCCMAIQTVHTTCTPAHRGKCCRPRGNQCMVGHNQCCWPATCVAASHTCQ